VLRLPVACVSNIVLRVGRAMPTVGISPWRPGCLILPQEKSQLNRKTCQRTTSWAHFGNVESCLPCCPAQAGIFAAALPMRINRLLKKIFSIDKLIFL